MRPTLIEALKLLDRELANAQTLYVCGGTAISLRFRSRPTADVDVIEPEVFGSLLAAAKRVAASEKGQHLGLNETWLNDHVGTIIKVSEVLPKDWKKNAERSGPLFKGQKLTVFALSKLDLLRTKLLSAISPDRGADAVQDLDDICSLSVSEDDILFEESWLMKADQFYAAIPSRSREFYQEFLRETVIKKIRGQTK